MSETTNHVYPKAAAGEQSANVAPNPSFPKLEESVLDYWEKDDTFAKSVERRPSGDHSQNEFVFFDGPPFANGLPHYGHLLTGYAKDVIPRYQTMKGRKVNRVFGWDTHGLPAELEAQKELGIDSVDQIKEIGIDKFNDACRASVLKYTNEWKDYVHRQARWVDFEHGYKTLNIPYMESVMWAFKQLYDKGLAYQGYRVLPYCPKDQTPLSAHELRMDADVYQDRQDTTVSVAVKLRDEEDAYAVFWTTTPWTVPTNFAIVVGADIDYVEVRPTEGRFAGKKFYLGKPLLGSYAKELGENYEIVRELKGAEMEGWRYYPVFPYFAGDEHAAEGQVPGPEGYQIFTADYVDTVEGTGLVHQAPYGEDDMNTLNAKGIKSVDVLDAGCKFTSLCPDYEGQYVFDANLPILRNLRAGDGPLARVPEDQRAILFQEKSYVHSYPHCWRCATPLIYKPVSSWFVSVTKIKDRLLELNQQINWIPDNVKDGQFGKWLANARDWSISRNRFWGSPIPVWVSDDPKYPRVDVYGSLDELKADFGDYPRDHEGNVNMHRPYIDELTRVNPDDPTGKSHMRRITDVMDCWFESGSMSFAQYHYPFENKEIFDDRKVYPADFIAEGVDQTRGWFFTLHAIATMVFDSVSYKAVVSNGLVLDKNGNKMSKRLGNAVDPFATIEQYGSDPLRWYMITNASPWDNIKFDIDGIEEVRRKFFGTLYNTYSFFALYANVDGFDYSEPDVDWKERPEIDRWILSLLNSLVKDVDGFLDTYEPTRAGRAISDFVNDNLSNWYVRLNRRRFWGGGMTTDKLSAYQTLYTCLETVAKLMAPIAPFYADRLFCDLIAATGREKVESVHLSEFPVCNEAMIDKDLEERMQMAQDVSSMVLALRRKVNIKVRQPLQTIMVPVVDAHQQESIEAVKALILNEVNVKELKFVDNAAGILVKKIKPDFKKLGPRYGKIMKALAAAIQAMSQDEINAFEKAGTFTLTVEGQEAMIERADVEIISEDIPGWLVANEGRLTVALDITVTENLRKEGLARELVNRIQNLRKSSGYDITDKISVTVLSNDGMDEAIKDFNSYIANQVLAVSVEITDVISDATEMDFEDFKLSVRIEKA